ncbi:hypothetical protein B0I00_2619 [Novosphingobium kunmingense]|uniref:Uncharacterized protein n=1 Tax=Novosphingobium kunmingense TaxID=1211806 RepID=A0A2N0H4W8_9SPHN|nr:hypothetical protein B0I00_2619 [Novosphingobium kunmingense]
MQNSMATALQFRHKSPYSGFDDWLVLRLWGGDCEFKREIGE